MTNPLAKQGLERQWEDEKGIIFGVRELPTYLRHAEEVVEEGHYAMALSGENLAKCEPEAKKNLGLSSTSRRVSPSVWPR